MKKVRIGIIGYGSMAHSHAMYLHENKIENGSITAVFDINPEKTKDVDRLYDGKVKAYDDLDEFYGSNRFDAILVATPHYFHPEYVIKSLEKGYHVLCEKPAGVYTKQVKMMNDAAKKYDKVFAMMFNQRTNPVYVKLKDLLDSGELGDLKRVVWVITDWYRPQSYYDSGTWRATWKGEGGGVLLNQDPHQLDLWQWMFGMPDRIRAFCYFGKYHDIEVEDDVTAYMEYESGLTGLFVTTTGESPGTNRLEISGDRGKLVVEKDSITFHRLRTPERQFNKEYQGGFGQPECWETKIPTSGKNLQHQGITQNFVNAILNGEPLIAPGEQGIHSLALSNAMLLSQWKDHWIDLPFDDDVYHNLLKEKISQSKEKTTKKDVVLNTSGSH